MRPFFACVSLPKSARLPGEPPWLADIDLAGLSGDGTRGAKGRGDDERSADDELLWRPSDSSGALASLDALSLLRS